MSGEDVKEQWVASQAKAFTRWLNVKLARKGFGPVEDIQHDWESGIKLIELVNALFNIPFPAKYNKTPSMRPHKLDNLQLGFDMIEAANVKTNFLKTTQLIDGDLKMILGMAWAFILAYSIQGISVDELTAKEGLLLWCKKKCSGYRDIDPPNVSNFSTSWQNGLAFCALIHRHRPNLIDYDSLSAANAAENLELAFSVAESLGIPRLLDVSDLLEVARPDERSVMTYVSEYFHRFAAEDMKEQAAGRVRRWLNTMREMEARERHYEQRAAELIAWVNTQCQEWSEHKHGETVEEAVAAFATFKSFVSTTKGEKAAEKLDVEALFAEIQTELLVNDRHAYAPPADLSTDALEAAWDRLGAAEKAHAQAIRDNRFRFIQKREVAIPQEKIDEFTASFKHFDHNNNNSLDRVEFKAALVALSVPFKDDDAANKVFDEVSEGQTHISLEQFIRFNRSINEDKDSPDQVKASFALIGDQQDTITAEQLRTPPMTEEDIAYITAKLTEVSPGVYDYKAFVDATFNLHH